MTAIEREPLVRPAPSVESERPVFLAADGRRARLLRVVAFAVTVLALLWLVALAAGMLGFGNLPGVSVPEFAKLGGGTPPPTSRLERENRSGERGAVQPASDAAVGSGRVGTPTSAEPRPVAERRSKPRPVRPPSQRPQPAQPAQPGQPAQPAPPAQPAQPPQAQAPPPPLTGRERRGLPAPPGHVRQTEPAPPPPGIRRGQATTTTPTTPPPPPPGNGKGGGPKQ
jgi:hypothetical protein